jgi:hypothetical protein
MSHGHSIFQRRHDGQSEIIGASALIAARSQGRVVTPVEFDRQLGVLMFDLQDGNVTDEIQMRSIQVVHARVGRVLLLLDDGGGVMVSRKRLSNG